MICLKYEWRIYLTSAFTDLSKIATTKNYINTINAAFLL